MRRIPRSVPAAGPVVMADLRSARPAARPVLARVVAGIRKSPAVRLRSRQHIVLVRLVPETVDRIALLGKRRRLGNIVAETRGFDRIAVQIAEILSDPRPLGVVPRALADAVPRIDGGFA